MAEAGYEFEVVPVDVDETAPEGVSPREAAVDIALRKARAAATGLEGAVIIAADTIVVSEAGEILGKPVDAAHATQMLENLSGSTHEVITGVAVLDTASGTETARAVSTTIVFGVMSRDDIEEYVASGEPMGKAGAYAIQETGDRFVEKVSGSFTNVVGLPMEEVSRMLASLSTRDEAGQSPHGGSL